MPVPQEFPASTVLDCLLAASPDAVVLLDEGLRIVAHSPAFVSLTGVRAGAVFTECLDPFTHPQAEKLFQALRSGEMDGDHETGFPLLHHKQDSGPSVPMQYSWVACRGRQGQVQGYFGIGRPADNPRADEELSRLRHELDGLKAERERRTKELARLRRKMESQSHLDTLTGLGNRRYILDRLQSELPRAIRYDHPLTLLLFDIDRMDDVNEKYGQEMGDVVIRRVAEVVREQVRGTDLVARYDGDEFMVLCPNTDRASSQFLAERLRRRIAELSFTGTQEGEEEEFGVTISTGLVTVHAGAPFETEAVLHAMHQALDAAKLGGLNRIQLMDTP
jgi:diguanylate cyclase (GGDEF)-like protein